MQTGRRTKRTPETAAKLVQAIRLGATYELACGYAGIDRSTFYRWMNADSDFYNTIKNAEGMGAIGWLAKIEKAANDGSWQAAAWKLERRYPEIYGRQRIDMHIDDWRSEAVAAIREEKITFEAAINVFGDPLARELFALAGVKHD